MGYFSSRKARIWHPKCVSILQAAKTIALQGCDVTNRIEDKSVMAYKRVSRREITLERLVGPGL